MLDLESKFFYRANSSGWAILQLLEAGATLEEILGRCRHWGASEESETEISELVARLVGENLVTSSPVAERPPAPYATNGTTWARPVIERQAQPLHRVISSAFDPSIPLAE